MLMSSCARLNSIHRESDFGDNFSTISVDAKQRFLLSRNYDATGKTVQKICAEPSPDVFSAFAASLSGSAKFKAFEAALSASSSESAATIGIRTQAIQLLRDGMYRICEGVLNGDIDKGKYVDLHQRYQRIMVTLVAIEQLTGAVRPPSVAIQTSALAGRPARLNELQSSLEDARKKVNELTKKVDDEGKKKPSGTSSSGAGKDATCDDPGENKDISNDSNCADYLTAKKNLDDANKNVASLDEKINQARSEMVNSASGSVTLVNQPSSGFQLDSESIKHISETVKNMVNSMFRLDPDSAVDTFAKYKCPIYLSEVPKIENAILLINKLNKFGTDENLISHLSHNDINTLIENSHTQKDNIDKDNIDKDLSLDIANNIINESYSRIKIAESNNADDQVTETEKIYAKTIANICQALIISINPDAKI